MICKGVTKGELEAIAEEVGVKLQEVQEGGIRVPFVRFTLRPIEGRYQRVDQLNSPGPARRVNAVCYHGHRAFLDLLFERFPAARVETAVARYDGASSYAELRDAADVWEGSARTGRVRTSTQCRCEVG
jgi:hypothetical protein